MENNSVMDRVRNTALLCFAVMVLCCAVVGLVAMSLWQLVFNPCKKK